MIMYYGGDLVEIIIIFILCLEWYREKGKADWKDDDERALKELVVQERCKA
ncbi:hypothetical protein [Gracilibacillus oryzae]|uniref:hypothetical protein n=1 Tax=Gracilibacillus oryzae TaxID=1672701 RepID=UPI002B1BD391|nr:hypothetical protein [Gracilibacillus oryzae]